MDDNETRSFLGRVRRHLTDHSERDCLAFVDSEGRYAWRSYRQVFADAARYAGRLQEAGLRKGDCCVISLPSDQRCAMVLLGTLWLGAVPLLVSPPAVRGHQGMVDVLAGVIRKSRPSVVVLTESLRRASSRFVTARPGARILLAEESFTDLDRPVAGAETSGSDPLAYQATSGTTSSPRVCVWSNDSILRCIDGMSEAMGITADDVFFNWSPLYHDMGIVTNFLLCLARGVPLALLSPTDFIQDPALWPRAMHDLGATVALMPNFGFAVLSERVADEDLESVRLDRVRGLWNGAERVHHETMKAFGERFAPLGLRPEALKTAYGCAEGIAGVTFGDSALGYRAERINARVLRSQKRALSPRSSRMIGEWVVGCGRPYPGAEVTILSGKGIELKDGLVGQIALRAPTMDGYLRDSVATRRIFRHGLLLTGDLGYMRDGELFWVGRLRERLKVSTRELDPSDFETALLEVDGLRKGCFAVFGIDDPDNGDERVVIVSELRAECPELHAEIVQAIRRRVTQRVGVSTSEVVLLPRGSLEKTSSGKRRHLHVRRQYLEGALEGLYVG